MTAARRSAAEIVAALADPGSWEPWDEDGDAAVRTGRLSIDGHVIAVVASEFAHLGGTIGVATADRIERAVRRATAERIPLVAAPASGGTRLQEGTRAFARMIGITRAVLAHRDAGLPYVVYLRDPSTGGVLASWGSLGHLTFAEPGAYVGFLGPRVAAAVGGAGIPAAVQTAEHLAERGIVDAVLAPADLRAALVDVFGILAHRETGSVLRRPPVDSPGRSPVTAWEAVSASRAPDALAFGDLLRAGLRCPVLLGGAGDGEPRGAIRAGLARLDGLSVVVIGQDRRAEADEPLGPGAFRTARRAIALAQGLALPIVTVIDTAGAELSAGAEERAIAGEIARCAADLVASTVPSVAVLLGQGAGGAAFALLPARRVVAAAGSWLAPLPPEGAAVILHGDAARAEEAAEGQGIRADDLERAGIVDVVVRGPDRAGADDGPGLAEALLAEAAAQLRSQSPLRRP